MRTAKLTSKGQVCIPKEIRDALGLETGDRLDFHIRDGRIMIIPATGDIRRLKGIIPKPARPVTIEEMNEAITRMGEDT